MKKSLSTRRKIVAPQPHAQLKEYGAAETPNQLPVFSPKRPPALHLEVQRCNMQGSGFQIIFTVELIHHTCVHANAWRVLLNKSSSGDKHVA